MTPSENTEQHVDEAEPGRILPGAPKGGPSRRASWLLMAILTIVTVGGDQASKQWAHTSLRADHGGRLVFAERLFSLTYVRNPGAAWGFLANADESFRRPFFIAVSSLAMIFILVVYSRLERSQKLLAIALALVMGGAVGNFIDRLRFDYVIDFLDVYIGTYRWPTFNVADIAISIGVFFLFADMIIVGIQQRRERASAAEKTPDEDREM